MNKDFERQLKVIRERWRPFNEWSDKIDERIKRLDVRTKLTLAKSAYLKAQAEMQAWQRAVSGGQGEVPVSAAPIGCDERNKSGKPRKRTGRSAASH
jgi:hypothetical protein